MYQPLTYIASIAELTEMSQFSSKPIDPRKPANGYVVTGKVFKKGAEPLEVPVMDLPTEHMADMVRDLCSIAAARYNC
ncbi:TPA: hypothetical protein ACF3I9_004434 [Klebsiella aerogenes]